MAGNGDAGTSDGTERPPHANLSLLSLDDETIAATSDGAGLGAERLEDEMPERIGRYLVLHELGAGAMGVVYAAYDPDLDRKLALKLLHDDEHSGGRTIRLLREAQALARVSHSNVIQVYDVGTFEERVYIAMEFIDGISLADWLAVEKRSTQTIVSVFVKAGHGLAAAHDKGLVHRDFKPDNVLVARDGRVVVLDFGIAHAVAKVERDEDKDPMIRSRVVEHSAAFSLASLTKDGVSRDGLSRDGSSVDGFDRLRGLEREDERSGVSSRTTDGSVITRALDAEVTRVGALIGTPAYMAPEQLEGRATDERSDQFSFCVALWQAIHGQRPFTGESPLALWQSMRNEGLRPPSSARIPGGIQRALNRGLSVEPDDRFADMRGLLAILERDPVAIRKRIGVAALTVGALSLAIWGAVDKPQVEPVCAGAEQRLVGSWDAERRAALEQAFTNLGTPLAGQALPAVLASLDDYAAQWQAMYTDACQATHVRGEQSSELLDLRMACLEDRKLGLDALVEVLLEPDATVVENSYIAVTKLRPIETCANQAVLRARVPPPQGPAAAERVEHIGRELSRARARRDAGDYERALAIAREAQSGAALSEYAPIQAAALIEIGKGLIDAGSFEEAEASLREGFYLALSSGDDEASADAATALVKVTGDRRQDFVAAHNWVGIADAILDRHDDQQSRARVELQYIVGIVRWRQGELERSRTELEAALGLALALGDDERLLEASVRKGLGSTLWGLGKHDEAAAQFQLVVDTLGRELGPAHPDVGSALNNLASAHFSQGKLDLAEQEFLRTLGVYELSYKTIAADGTEVVDHPSLANTLNNLAVVYTKRGKLEQARDTHIRVLGIHERTLGPEHPELANSWSNLGRVLRQLHDLEGAADYYQRAYERRTKALGPEHSDTMTSLAGLALTQIDLGQHEQGLASFEIVLETQRRVLGEDHPTVAELEHELGVALVGIGQHRQAQALLRKSLATRERILAPDHRDIAASLAAYAHALVASHEYAEAKQLLDRFRAMEDASSPALFDRAQVRLDLAQVLVATGQRAQAIELARAGAALLADAEGPNAKQLRRELQRWVDANSGE
ncbi:Serine/threonine protein kinase [Enhygromyxa salina]|uniref:Serine/threonine protein kinase n=1 Tax=Enhygromyxa salina TaxID=215803 RepID=A0A0C2DEJ8_9BACT|nr:serine/threonine-protein kinase [Enhygromyxa salina]KIG18107.1 Serine/threonine protein kinase [Enhygromyxa salina]